MGSGVKCKEILIFCFCFIALICSLGLLSLGIIALTTVFPYFYIDPAFESKQPPILTTQLMILNGISGACSLLAIILFSFCSLHSKQCGINFVAPILAVALIGEQVMITKIYLGREEALEQITNNLNNSLPLYNNNPDIKHFWNDMQTNLECCGVKGPSDWSAVYGNSTSLPPSCCHGDKPCFLGSSDVWNSSCGDHVAQQLHEKMNAMYSVTLAIYIIEGIAAASLIAALVCLLLLFCCYDRIIKDRRQSCSTVPFHSLTSEEEDDG